MSNYITGSSAKAWFGKELTRGEGYTGTPKLLNMTSESINTTYNRLDEETLLASKTQTARDLGSVDVSGDINTILRPSFAPLLFELALGKVEKTSTDPTVEGAVFDEWTYTLADVDEDLPTSEVIIKKGKKTVDNTTHDNLFRYKGMTVTNLTLECPAQDFVSANTSFVGLDEVYQWADGASAGEPVVTQESSFKCTQAKLINAAAGSDDLDNFSWSWDTCPAGEVYDVNSSTLTFDNGVESTPATYCSGLYAAQPVHGQRSVTIQCSVPYSNSFETFRQTYYANEEAANLALMVAFCTKDTYDYTYTPSGSEESVTVKRPKEQVFVIIPYVNITDMSANVGGQGIVDGSFTGEALSIGSTEPVKVIYRKFKSLAQ